MKIEVQVGADMQKTGWLWTIRNTVVQSIYVQAQMRAFRLAEQVVVESVANHCFQQQVLAFLLAVSGACFVTRL